MKCRYAEFITTSSLLASCVMPSAVYAQVAGTDAALGGAPTNIPSLEEVIVTAQKRRENLQDVPIAISTLSASQAAREGVTDTTALAAAVSGLVFTQATDVGTPFIRGVGTNQAETNSEQSVALYIDGVYIAAPTANLFSLNNVEAIEVLKGPQGTLFGRNATGGVINIITPTPRQTPSGNVSIGYGNYGDVQASAYLTGGITSNLAADLSVRFENQADGFGRNIFLGRDADAQARGNYDVRTKWLFTPTDSSTLTLSADTSHFKNTYAYQELPGLTSTIDPAIKYPGPYNSTGSLYDQVVGRTSGGSIRIDQDIGKLQFVNITAFRNSDENLALDEDATPLRAVDLTTNQSAKNWSEEVQLKSSVDSWLKWLGGVFFYDATAGYFPLYVNGRPVLDDSQKTKSYAAFGQATAEILPATNLTGGLRYTYEVQNFLFPADGALDARQSFNKLTYRTALEHQFSKSVNAYISYNVGFKSGGFNLTVPGNSFQPEVLDASEIGLKSELFDRRLRLNIASYLYHYQNIQVSEPNGLGVAINNAAGARIKGVDVDVQVEPISGLQIIGNASYIDGYYSSYPDAVSISSTGVQTIFQATGKNTIQTPKFTGSLSLQYSVATPVGNVLPAVTASYDDGFAWYADNRLRQPAYTLLNLSVSWAPPSDLYQVKVWAKNLTDATYYLSRVSNPGFGDFQEQAPPRTFGFTVSTHF